MKNSCAKIDNNYTIELIADDPKILFRGQIVPSRPSILNRERSNKKGKGIPVSCGEKEKARHEQFKLPGITS